MPTLTNVTQRIDLSVASLRTVPLTSAQADSILLSINLEYMSDLGSDSVEEARDSGHSDTVSAIPWAATSRGLSTDVSDSRLL